MKTNIILGIKPPSVITISAKRQPISQKLLNHVRSTIFLLGCLLFVGEPVDAQIVDVGGIARNFTITDRATGRAKTLKGNYRDRVIVLDFFAYWCAPCSDSSKQVETDIKQYYESRGGNAYGVPVTVIPVNIEPSDEGKTDKFIKDTGISGVVNDYQGKAYGEFSTGSIPLYVIINSRSDALGYSRWQVLYRTSGYEGADTLKAVIDSVNPSATPPSEDDCDYTVSAKAKPVYKGTVSGANAYYEGEQVVVKAEPKKGKKFLYWCEGKKIVSKKPTYRFEISRNRKLTAYFQ